MYDLEEQEQLDALKAWWKQHGKKTVAAVTLAVLVAGGFKGWQYYRNTQAMEAATLYQALADAAQAKDSKKVRDVAGQIIEKYAGTAYAPRAALIVAGANYDSGDAKSAKAQLQWVIEHASETQLQDAARLRLGGMLLEEKQYDEAVKLLDAKHDSAFDGLYNDLRGDVLAAQGKLDDARKAYQSAIEQLDKKNDYHNLVQMKLDALGGAK